MARLTKLPRIKTIIAIAVLVGLTAPLSVSAGDTDGDGLDDAWEREHFGTLDFGGSDDPDRDGLSNEREFDLGTNPMRIDTDGDFLRDGEEVELGTDPLLVDTDGDGLEDAAEVRVIGSNPLVIDTDQGGSTDGAEVYVDHTDPLDKTDDKLDQDSDGLTFYRESLLGTSDVQEDTDSDGLPDGVEDANRNGNYAFDTNQNGRFDPGAGDETDPLEADTDGDGLPDGLERDAYGSDPYMLDTDGDDLEDGEEHNLRRSTYDCLEPAVADSDYDGLDDGAEINVHGTDPCDPDTDGDGIFDAVEVDDQTSPTSASSKLPDSDGDGLSDRFETEVTFSRVDVADTDGDNIDDGQEWFPLDDRLETLVLDADSDDDGLLDGNEGGVMERTGLTGGTNPLEADTDGDGLGDGLELGLTAPQHSPEDPDATDGSFAPDSDPSTTTSPTSADTDGDGLSDGEEDANQDGKRQSDETDPELFDTDDDGMDDGWETRYSAAENCEDDVSQYLDPLDPSDANRDIDNDGLDSIEEYRATRRDAQGNEIVTRTVPCDVDSDDDGIDDGVEVYSNYGGGRGTDPLRADTDGDGLPDGVEDANQDGMWQFEDETSPLLRDTDGDQLSDGHEDANANGLVDDDETDPLEPDTDGDGLADGQEIRLLGTDPLLADTDGDGLGDGLEVGLGADTDPGTQTDPLRADTDNDGLADGVEDANRNGATDQGETDPLLADTDGDRLDDGVEDANGNGRLDPGETDPRDPDTDDGGVEDGVEVHDHGTDPRDGLDDWTADPDGDGIVNRDEILIGTDWLNPDTDGDYISDGEEVGPDHTSPLDTDGDGTIDALDLDSDNDSRPDAVEAGDEDIDTPAIDTDGDGIKDFRDLDSDNGGVPDNIEVVEHFSDPEDPSDDGVGYFEGPVTGGAGCSSAADNSPPVSAAVVVLLGLLALVARWRRRGGSAVAAAVTVTAVLAVGQTASAQHPDAYNTALEVNSFRLEPSGHAVFSTGTGEVLGHMDYRIAASSQFLSRPLVVDPNNPDLFDRPLVDQRYQVNASATVGFYNFTQLSVIVPYVAEQSAQYPGFGLGSVASRGIGDVEMRPEVRLLRENPFPATLSLAARLTLPTSNGNAYLGRDAVTAEPQVRVSRTLGPFALAVNLGALFQPTTSINNIEEGRRLTGSAGLRWNVAKDGYVGLEAIGSGPLTRPFEASHERRAEVVFGGGFTAWNRVDLHVGVGRGVLRGIGSPQARGFMSIAYKTGSVPVGEIDCSPDSGTSPEDCPVEDWDGDNIENRADMCPRQAEDVDGFEDDDGCPDTDNDQDGISDISDECPMTPEDFDGVADHDGCPESDFDEDGIVDEIDDCPLEAEVINAYRDEDGCPDEKPENVEVRKKRLDIQGKIYFETQRATLQTSSYPLLDEIARVIQENPEIKRIEIRGYADARGGGEYNYFLSKERARSVKHYLVAEGGVASDRLVPAGYGAFMSDEEKGEASQLAKQRRVEFEIIERE
ncbi:MAG: OmpA family protein [Myxococcota bacterium]